MSDCTNPKYENLLHAYELNLLTEEERNELEKHIIECDTCYEKLKKLDSAVESIHINPEIKSIICDIVEGHPDEIIGHHVKSKRVQTQFGWRKVGFSMLIILILLAVFILTDWEINIGPKKEAFADQNRLAIMYFTNRADQNDSLKLGEIVSSLLIADISESQYLRVISSQRMYDLLKAIGREGEKNISKTVASEIAVAGKATWMLTGDILQTEPSIILASQLADVKTGDVIASQRITGEKEEDIFAVVDELTRLIKQDLFLPVAAQDEPDPLVASMTSSSLEAYRYYLEAREYYYKGFARESEARLQKALEYDPEFAIAYAMLASMKITASDPAMVTYAQKAMDNIDRAGQKGQYYIRGLYAFTQRDFQETDRWCRKVIERYPDDKYIYFFLSFLHNFIFDNQAEAVRLLHKAMEIDSLWGNIYGELSMAYQKLDIFDSAIWAVDRYIELSANEPRAYHTKGKIFLWQGEADSAIVYFEKTLAIKPDYRGALHRLGRLYLYKRHYQNAEYLFTKFSNIQYKHIRSLARTWLALIPLHEGKLLRALEILDDGIAADRLENATHGEKGDRANKHLIKASIYQTLGDIENLLKEFDYASEIIRQEDTLDIITKRHLLVHFLTEIGQTVEAREVYDEMLRDLEDTDCQEAECLFAAASIELASGNSDKAIQLLNTIPDTELDFESRYLLGKAYLKAGQYTRSFEVFSKTLTDLEWQRLYWGIWVIKTHYYLGLAFENSGQHNEAIQQYQAFLDIWKDADTELPEYKDARLRLTRLQTSL